MFFLRFSILKYLFYNCLLMLVKKTKFGNNLPKLMLVEVSGQCNMCERDVVPAGTALLDNGHELRDAVITS